MNKQYVAWIGCLGGFAIWPNFDAFTKFNPATDPVSCLADCEAVAHWTDGTALFGENAQRIVSVLTESAEKKTYWIVGNTTQTVHTSKRCASRSKILWPAEVQLSDEEVKRFKHCKHCFRTITEGVAVQRGKL